MNWKQYRNSIPVPVFSVLICLILVLGCSQAQDTILPSTQSQDAHTTGNDVPGIPYEGTNNRSLLGQWLIRVDPVAMKTEIVPVRATQIHWNVLKWLEQGPCTNCLKIVDMSNSDHGTKLVTVSIKHPFPSQNLTGFDVRGIVMFNGSHLFPTAGLNISDRDQGDGELINPDGFTTLYNFTSIGFGPGGLQGYLKGKLASATAPDGRLNGFKRFETSNPGNTRNAFYAGDTIVQQYDIDMPDSAFVFGYAVDASWVPPSVSQVTDPMNDFPPEANCFEPYQANVNIEEGSLVGDTGYINLIITVSDHQGSDSHLKPVLECPELIDASPYIFDYGNGEYHCEIWNEKKAPPGIYEILVSVEDSKNAGSPAWIDLTAYQVFSVEVHEDGGWARSWGGSGYDRGTAVDATIEGDVYVVGYYQGIVDFNPGAGVGEHSSNSGSIDAFLCKYDSTGIFIWAKTWGGPGTDTAEDVDCGENYIYVVGNFEETVDFDPGAGVSNVYSHGETDAYVSKFNNEDVWSSAERWGGDGDDEANSVCDFKQPGLWLDAWVTGSFEATAFFDGSGKESNGKTDVYIYMLDDPHEVYTWGGPGEDVGLGIEQGGHDDTMLVTGIFMNQVNFSPWGTDVHSSNGSFDAFLSYYSYDDTFYMPSFTKAITWGGPSLDYASSVCSYGSRDYVTGYFSGTVNFNPDTGGTPHIETAAGLSDAYVSYFIYGTFQDVTTWGGSEPLKMDSGYGITADWSGNVYCSGSFAGDSFGTTSKGNYDAVVAKYSSNLSLISATTWGGTGSDGSKDICANYWDRLFVTGGYQSTVDFDPRYTVENHTSNGGVADCYLMKFMPDGSW